MSIYKDNELNDENPNVAGELMPVEKVRVVIEDGTTLVGSMLLDKDGNETEILYDAVSVMCKHPDGSWYDIDITNQTWESHTLQ